MKVLNLTLKKKWFDMIESKEKKEEYREIKDYWLNRLIGKKYDHIKFINGYGDHRPWMVFKIKKLVIGYGKEGWCDNPLQKVFVFKLGDRIL